MCLGMSRRQGNPSRWWMNAQPTVASQRPCLFTKPNRVETGVTGRFGNWTWGTYATKELPATKRADYSNF